MAYKVIQWAPGQVGSSAVKAIVGHPDLELVGSWVYLEEEEGRDIGELCGLKPLGVLTTRDKDALLAMPADCVCCTIARTWVQNPMETVAELAQILRAGKNVVSSYWPALVYPQGVSEDVYKQLQDACLDGGSTFYTSGIDPGFGTMGLALAAMTVCRGVRSIRMYELLNYSTWGHPDMIRMFGFGQPYDDNYPIYTPGWTTSIFGSSLTFLADLLGVQIDKFAEWHDVIYADEAFNIPAIHNMPDIHIAAGTVSGVRFGVRGMVDGEARFEVEHVTKLRDQDFPEVPFPGMGGYRVEVDGEPCVKLDLELSQHNGDPASAALSTVAHTIVNAIPKVCDAEPGVLSYIDLTPHPSKNLLR